VEAGATASAVTLAALSGWLIVRAAEQPPIMYLLVAIVGVRFFGIARAVLRYLERLTVHDAALRMSARLRAGLWGGLAAVGLSHRRLLSGDSVVDGVVAVPIYGAAESLNLATAASVCLYESAFALRS